MSGQWKEVACLRFVGERFRDHALDLSAITELRQFQKIVALTSKALWRAANPGRERLPPHFEERTRLCLREIEDGSAVIPLVVPIEKTDQGELWEPEQTELIEAIALAYEAFDCAAKDQPLPERLPKELIPDYAEWGSTLGPNEEVQMQRDRQERPVRVNAKSRERLGAFVEAPHASSLELTGEVLEADVHHRRFQLWTDERTPVSAMFTEDQEELVTAALKDHHSVRVCVRGRADFSPGGKPIRFTEVSELRLLQGAVREFDPQAPSVEDELARIAKTVPESEWAKLPVDLTDHLDDYIYGTPDE